MSEYVLKSVLPLCGANLIRCSGSISKSIKQLRKGGATNFIIMGRQEDGNAFWNFSLTQGKEIPYLNCLANGCCIVERRSE